MNMTKGTKYAEIKIDISAPQDKINYSSEELKLSDELYHVEFDLGEWLKKRLASTSFGFHIQVK
jgi:hypothetical protein